MRKKTLAEEIAELVNPVPVQEFDPEADIFGEGPVVEDYQEDDVGSRRSRKSAVEKTRLRGDIVLDDRSYGGKITSRAAMFDEEDMGGSDDENNEGDLGDEDQMMMAGLSDRQRDSEDSEDGEGGYADPQNTVDEVAGNFEEEYYQLQQEEAQTVQLLKQHRDAQRKKGLAVQAQQRIWDGALEIRILLQRALQAANRLPRSKARDAIKKIDSNMFNGLQSVANVAAGALEDVLSLLCAIEKQNPALLESANSIQPSKQSNVPFETSGRKRKSEELWGQLDDAYNRFIPFRDAAVDRWHRKTILTSGTAARGGLKVLNQSISSQVKMLMQDVERVVERSRLPKRLCTALCSVESETKHGELVTEAPADDSLEGTTIAEQRDPETYDDTEFYQNLLREFLDGKQGAIASVYSGPKQRKMVDRRASKGRKIRYNIHDKLVNFMTPIELNTPQFASSVFANLFGGSLK